MKKLVFGMVAIASVAMVGCTQEMEQIEMNDMKNVEFTGTIVDVDTRTSMDNTGKVIWCENDPVSIFMRNGNHYKYQSNSGGTANTTFAYADWYSKGSATLDQNYAVYPFDEENAFDAATKKFTVDLSGLATQTYTENNFEEGKSVMTAKASDTNLPFYNALSMLNVRLNTSVPDAYRITEIEIKSAKLALSGEGATIDMSREDGRVAAELASGDKTITLDCDNDGGVVISTDYTNFYILVPANSVEANDFTITITAIDEFTGEVYTTKETIAKDFTFERSKIVTYERTLTSEDWKGNIEPDASVSTRDALQTALDAAEAGETVIVLTADIDGDVTVTQKPDVKITIEGNGYKYNGVILVDGKSKTYTTAGLTINNMNFVAESISADACIRLGDGTNATRYTCNVTVSGCTFDVPGAVGIKSYTGGDKNLTIKGCTATANAHSLVQAKGIDGILVENCNVYSKNGLNFNNSTNVSVDDCTVDVKGYAVRFGESSGGVGAAETYSITNSRLKSANDDNDATIILRGTADYSTLTIDGNTTIEGNPKITNTATGAKVVIDGAVYVASTNALSSVLTAGYTDVLLADGTYTIPSAVQNRTVKIVGSSKENTQIDATNALTYVDGSTLTLENLTIKSVATTGYDHGLVRATSVVYNGCLIEGSWGLFSDSEFNNCEFNVEGDWYNVWTWGAPTAKFTGCTFNCDGKAMLLYSTVNTKLTMNGCTFNDNGGLTDLKAAIEIGNDYGKSYELIVNNAIVNGFEINDKGINTGTTLWANKNSMGTDKLNVVVDGVDVY